MTAAGLKSIIIKAISVVLIALVLALGYKLYQSQKQEISGLNETVEQLKKDKEDLKKELSKKTQSDEVTESIKEEVKEEVKQVEIKKSQAHILVEKKLNDIQAKYATLEQTEENKLRMETEISLERAKGLWLSFCLHEPEANPCE